MAAEPALADAGAREAALDVGASWIVQAPAGSGKTGLLIQRYLRLLAIVERPEEILAITFTRKAAAEMRHRIRAAFAAAQSPEAPPAAHEAVTWRAAKAALERDRRQGWELARNPQRMQIQTLDSFNARLAQALPLSSGLGGRLRMLETGEQGLYREAARATLDWIAETGDPRAFATRDLLAHLDNDVAAWIEALARMLARRDQWLPLISSGAGAGDERVRAELEASLRALVARELEAAQAALDPALAAEWLRHAAGAASRLAEAAAPSALAPLAGLAGWPRPVPDALPAWQALAGFARTRSGGWRKRLDKTLGFAPGERHRSEKEAALALIRRLEEEGGDALGARFDRIAALPAPAYDEDQWRALTASLAVLPLAVAELRRLFAARGLADYIEIALAARRALGEPEAPSDLTLALDYRLRHLLIDEMQDTSASQYRLIETLVAGWQPDDGHTLFCVGDPMQSIYRFREAEVGRFIAARRHGIGPMPLGALTLATNFRSGPGIVDWVNRVFAGVMPEEEDPATGAVAYSPSVAGGSHDPGRCDIHPVLGTEPEREAGVALDCVRAALAEDDRAEVAVLVRSRTHLAPLVAALRREAIGFEAVEIDRLTDLPEVQDLIALARALSHPLDRIAWLALLRAPWCGLKLASLHALVRDDRKLSLWRLLHDPERCDRLEPDERERLELFCAHMAAAIGGNGSLRLRDRVERLWYTLDGPAALPSTAAMPHVERFLDLLSGIEVDGMLPADGAFEERLAEERVTTLGGSDCRLRLMTVHKAKGLEFDTVVLPGLGRTPRSSDRPVLHWTQVPDDEGEERPLLAPIGARASAARDPLHEYLQWLEREHRRHELDRLLYVACTRARRRLHLIGHVALDDEGRPRRPPAGTLLARLWPELEADYERAAEHAEPDRKTPDAAHGASAELVQPLIRRYVLGRTPLAPPSPPPTAPALPRAARGLEEEVPYEWVGPTGRAVGTVVHVWLHRIAAEGDLDGWPARLPGLEPLHRRLLAELGLPEDACATEAAAVTAALERTLADPRGRWILDPGHRQAASELAVSGLVDGELRNAVIDRFFVTGEGEAWIVDYKTARHEGAGLGEFLASEAERHRPQLARYSALVEGLTGEKTRTALYFPLLARFVELDRAQADQ